MANSLSLFGSGSSSVEIRFKQQAREVPDWWIGGIAAELGGWVIRARPRSDHLSVALAGLDELSPLELLLSDEDSLLSEEWAGWRVAPEGERWSVA
jgi:hypothetical protein